MECTSSPIKGYVWPLGQLQQVSTQGSYYQCWQASGVTPHFLPLHTDAQCISSAPLCVPGHPVVPNSCDPTDRSPPGSSVPGILQARILEWVAIAWSVGSSRPRNQTQVSCIAGSLFTNWAMRERLSGALPALRANCLPKTSWLDAVYVQNYCNLFGVKIIITDKVNSFIPTIYVCILTYCVCMRACCHLSRVPLFTTPWTVAHQAPLSMGFSRREYWNGLPCPPPGDLFHSGSNPNLLQLMHCRQILHPWATRVIHYTHINTCKYV